MILYLCSKKYEKNLNFVETSLNLPLTTVVKSSFSFKDFISHDLHNYNNVDIIVVDLNTICDTPEEFLQAVAIQNRYTDAAVIFFIDDSLKRQVISAESIFSEIYHTLLNYGHIIAGEKDIADKIEKAFYEPVYIGGEVDNETQETDHIKCKSFDTLPEDKLRTMGEIIEITQHIVDQSKQLNN